MSQKRTQRVVLVKPGDVLLIGNAGRLGAEEGDQEFLGELVKRLGIQVVIFEQDIEIGRLSQEQVIELAKGDRG